MDESATVPVQLFGTRTCRYTSEVREELLWNGVDFIEYDVDADRDALVRMLELTGGQRTVPVLVKNGLVTQVGWHGLGCIVNESADRAS